MRQDYCPIGGAPCQSMCDEPCLSTAKKRIAELELALQKQAKAALHGMDAAKASGTAMIKAATEMQSQLKPELIESERQANAVLTQENEKLHQQIEQLREALSLLLDCAIHGYDMPEDHSYAIISRNALEQTE